MVDVVVIGGGPAGSTIGAILKKYAPSLNVLILEREQFPRDHVGESLLPSVCTVLDEMGVWDKVEAADFPIKIGATYRWGNTDDLWDFDFLSAEAFQDQIRPAKYVGQRAKTAFQVDRSIFDKILLDHCRELGCEVRESVKVKKVMRDGDAITGLEIEDSSSAQAVTAESITARYYIDASGDSGILRRAMDVQVDSPTSLRNIAIWDYWQNAEWAVEIGVGGTRIQVMSLGYGWIWFIPLGPTRTSVGFVLPAQTYKDSGETPEQIYLRALSEEPRISEFLKNASRENLLHTTKDWSFIAKRLVGENWFLVGDSCGFADPILSAGMTLAQVGARCAAYTIVELDRGEFDKGWLKEEYEVRQQARIAQHIRFADFWYSSNGCFTDLKENCAAIARDAGLVLSADAAFQWLGTGGFANEDPGLAQAVTYNLAALKQILQHFSQSKATWAISRANEFRVNLVGATKRKMAIYRDGHVVPTDCYVRKDGVLPFCGAYGIVLGALHLESDGRRLMSALASRVQASKSPDPAQAIFRLLEALEALVSQGWVTARVNKKRPFIAIDEVPFVSDMLHPNRD